MAEKWVERLDEQLVENLVDYWVEKRVLKMVG